MFIKTLTRQYIVRPLYNNHYFTIIGKFTLKTTTIQTNDVAIERFDCMFVITFMFYLMQKLKLLLKEYHCLSMNV